MLGKRAVAIITGEVEADLTPDIVSPGSRPPKAAINHADRTRRMVKTLVRPISAVPLGIALISGVVGCKSPPDDDIHKTFRHRDYAGSRDRRYIVHLPSGYDAAGRPLPLVMALHGCHEDHETIRHDTDFNRVADREGFLVVYPYITSYDGLREKNCWGFWRDEHIHEGRGEVQDLGGILEEVRRDYRVDPDRIHIAGVSSGAAMAVAAMVAHSELIASGSPTAGEPYGETPASVGRCLSPGAFKPLDQVVGAMDAEMGAAKRPVPILIIHSTGDCMVNIRASRKIRDSWARAFGVDLTSPVASDSGVTKGTRWTHTRYGGSGGRTVVETLFVEGLPHGWYGDRDGEYAFSQAPDTAQLAWEFFKTHPRQR
jgi:poly(hydroxyalkanoate) depolymerase family esterase